LKGEFKILQKAKEFFDFILQKHPEIAPRELR
jgi:hypothetical protein